MSRGNLGVTESSVQLRGKASLYMGIYNNYAHFTSFFLICRALLLLWLMTKESYKHFQHLNWDEGSGDIKLLFNILIFLILTGIVAEPRSSLFSWLFPCSKSLQHHLSRLLINKSQITWSEKVSKHVDQNFSPVQSREDFWLSLSYVSLYRQGVEGEKK